MYLDQFSDYCEILSRLMRDNRDGPKQGKKKW